VLTVDELIIGLRDTNIPTILVEGVDDIWIYRELRSILEANHIDVQSCGGRNNLIQVFERRLELGRARVAFIADRDFWIYSDIPVVYSGISFSRGYSIENDLLAEYNYRTLVGSSRMTQFDEKLRLVLEWYCHEVRNGLSGRGSSLAESIYRLFTKAGVVNNEFLAERCFTHIDDGVFHGVLSNVDLMLRGKTLLQFICWFLGRVSKRSHYSGDTLLDICVKHQTATSILGSRFMELANSLAKPV